MERWVLRTAVLVVVSVIVNVTVAWRCFIFGNLDQSMLNWSNRGQAEPATPSDVEWMAASGPPGMSPPILSSQQELPGYELRVIGGGGPEDLPANERFFYAQRYRVGWPLAGFGGEEFRWRLPASGRDQYEYHGMIVFRDRITYMPPLIPFLPIRPIWPGFAINTLFYAAILWMLFALGGTPFALRRRMRIKRGLCPKCAYDLRGGAADSQTCPECGAVRSRHGRSPADNT